MLSEHYTRLTQRCIDLGQRQPRPGFDPLAGMENVGIENRLGLTVTWERRTCAELVQTSMSAWAITRAEFAPCHVGAKQMATTPRSEMPRNLASDSLRGWQRTLRGPDAV
jgi:hypothetical protein